MFSEGLPSLKPQVTLTHALQQFPRAQGLRPAPTWHQALPSPQTSPIGPTSRLWPSTAIHTLTLLYLPAPA